MRLRLSRRRTRRARAASSFVGKTAAKGREKRASSASRTEKAARSARRCRGPSRDGAAASPAGGATRATSFRATAWRAGSRRNRVERRATETSSVRRGDRKRRRSRAVRRRGSPAPGVGKLRVSFERAAVRRRETRRSWRTDGSSRRSARARTSSIRARCAETAAERCATSGGADRVTGTAVSYAPPLDRAGSARALPRCQGCVLRPVSSMLGAGRSGTGWPM